MVFKELELNGCFLIETNVFEDERGCFFENYNSRKYAEFLDHNNFVQDNISISKRGVLRGLHFQKGNYSQSKLVTVLKGEVQDVVIDLRPNSRTFGKHLSMVLNNDNRQQLFVPKGFAHGFLTLSEEAIFSYKCDSYYNKPFEAGIAFNDPYLAIKWKMKCSEITLSSKDKSLPFFKDLIL